MGSPSFNSKGNARRTKNQASRAIELWPLAAATALARLARQNDVVRGPRAATNQWPVVAIAWPTRQAHCQPPASTSVAAHVSSSARDAAAAFSVVFGARGRRASSRGLWFETRPAPIHRAPRVNEAVLKCRGCKEYALFCLQPERLPPEEGCHAQGCRGCVMRGYCSAHWSPAGAALSVRCAGMAAQLRCLVAFCVQSCPRPPTRGCPCPCAGQRPNPSP